jgi:hypothetical protein
MQFIFRFVAGGSIASLFAALGDVLKPKSFAGLFGAAPSVALATLGLPILLAGRLYAAHEARSMIAGALAFFVYAIVCSHLLISCSAADRPPSGLTRGCTMLSCFSASHETDAYIRDLHQTVVVAALLCLFAFMQHPDDRRLCGSTSAAHLPANSD